MTDDAPDLLTSVSRRLFVAMMVPLAFALTFVTWKPESKCVVPAVVISCGVIGGFVGLQRRLKNFTNLDLQLIRNSWIYTCLAPMVGGVLALLLYVLFLSGLLTGDLFPKFIPDGTVKDPETFSIIFQQHGYDFQSYAKLIFWCFVAGYSERCVTDVISRFEGAAVKGAPRNW
jgi:hypothetical protein